MRTSETVTVLSTLLAVVLSGCGGSQTPPSPPAAITFTFIDNAPTNAVLQTGTGPFTLLAAQNNQLVVNLPAGTSKYTLAYLCPTEFGTPNTPPSTLGGEIVIEATPQDGAVFNASCPRFQSGAVTVGFDVSQLAAVNSVQISDRLGGNVVSGGTAVTVPTTMPLGINDVGVIALDASNVPIAVRIVRSQTVPGAINGGNLIVLGPSNLTTQQPVTVNNIPPGFNPPFIEAVYHTANGLVPLNGSATQYSAVPSSEAQPGDFYVVSTSAEGTLGSNFSLIGVVQRSAGGPLTANLPQPWAFSGPVPVSGTFPKFQMDYTGFTGAAGSFDSAAVSWQQSTFFYPSIEVIATPGFLNGSDIVTVPDLSSLRGFFAPPTTSLSGNIQWTASIVNVPLSNTVISGVFTIVPGEVPLQGSLARVSSSGAVPLTF